MASETISVKLRFLFACRNAVRACKPASWIVWKWVQHRHNANPETGWLNSFRSGQSIDASGNPLPWITYDATSYLDGVVTKSMKVFEYGCGNSTLWWAKRVARVVSCEHHQEWYQQVSSRVPENVTLHLKELNHGDEYPNCIQSEAEMFDVIVVDGRRRVQCVNASISKLAEGGMIILDNSDRKAYEPAIQQLQKEGFTETAFPGLAPISTLHQQTSIFQKAGPA